MATKINNEYTEFLDSILYYKGRGANNGVWESWVDKDHQYDTFELTVPHSWKTIGKAQIWYYINEYPNDYSGHEFKIDIYLNSYCEFFTMFEGWVDSLDELKTIIKCVGIPLNIKNDS